MAAPEFDLVVIGGGITGAGLFREAAARGLRVLLLEKGAAGSQTTAASSGLVHGGLRYLSHDVATSRLCCRESDALRRLYPELLRRQVFLWPVYRADRYGIELIEALHEYYDRFADSRGGRRHVRLAAAEATELEPALSPDGLLGALCFDEWAVDPVALVHRLLEEGRGLGGEWREGSRATGFERRGGRIERVLYSGPGGERTVAGRIVVNATGPWAEETARLAGCAMVRLSLRKGVHLVLDETPARHGLIFEDLRGRAIGLFPHGRGAWVGPTDDPFEGSAEGVAGTPEEAERLWDSLRRLIPGLPREGLRTVAGVRPIVRQALPGPLSRDWRVYDHAREGVENLVTVAGGKLTIFRPMVEETLGHVCAKLGRGSSGAGSPASRHRPFVSLLASVILLAFFVARHCALRILGARRSGLELFRRTFGDAA